MTVKETEPVFAVFVETYFPPEALPSDPIVTGEIMVPVSASRYCEEKVGAGVGVGAGTATGVVVGVGVGVGVGAGEVDGFETGAKNPVVEEAERILKGRSLSS